LKNNDDIPELDVETLFWTEFEPLYSMIRDFTLFISKKRKQGADPKLKAKSFLSMVNWRETISS
jgi:hypothetical protein